MGLAAGIDHSEGTCKTHGTHGDATMNNDLAAQEFQLRFQSLFDSGRGFAFPCDPAGHVNIDSLSERARNNYFFARAMVGRELSVPAVEAVTLH
jgi:hypothetical protein